MGQWVVRNGGGNFPRQDWTTHKSFPHVTCRTPWPRRKAGRHSLSQGHTALREAAGIDTWSRQSVPGQAPPPATLCHLLRVGSPPTLASCQAVAQSHLETALPSTFICLLDRPQGLSARTPPGSGPQQVTAACWSVPNGGLRQDPVMPLQGFLLNPTNTALSRTLRDHRDEMPH